MKRLVIAFIAIALAATSLWAKDEEVIVTRQLTLSQRNSLPEKTITVEMKQLVPAKKADAAFIDAINQVMDTIAAEEYQSRTFVLFIEPKASGEIAIAAHNDDIVTRGSKQDDIYYGDLAHGRYHFVLLTGKNNVPLLEQTFKRQGKVKFVQEFEFVDFKTPISPTSVIALWSPTKGLTWEAVIINEDPNSDRDSFDRPAHAQE
ncbi:MAG: hypothetical protein IJK93_05785 [Muribaculaceae bacterium]|nr:hypothetical protein [Muribaculaceae bacterium]